MPELLLRDEEESIEWQTQENRLGRIQADIDANVMLWDFGYVDYLHYFSQIRSYMHWFASRGEYIVIGQPFAYVAQFIPLVRGQEAPGDVLYVWPGGGEWPTSEQVYVVADESPYEHRGEALILAELSRTTSLFGYALPRQLRLSIEQSAFDLLENLTLASITQKVLAIIASEKRQGGPIESVALSSFRDPEATDYEQLVVTVRLDCDSGNALRIWDDLSKKIESLKEDLSQREISVLNERLGLDCEW